MIVYVLQAMWLDEAKEVQQEVEGVFEEFLPLKDAAACIVSSGRSVNPPMFHAFVYDTRVFGKGPIETWSRMPSGAWEKIPPPAS